MPSLGTSDLNNYLQAKGRLHSLSWLEANSGPRHAPTWTMTAKSSLLFFFHKPLKLNHFLVDGQVYAVGIAMQKNVARDIAATETLRRLRQEDQ
ncbi:hypothetical protein K435DRAFT_483745 [Dendrothele bispora CBS 962.96]|uniref:DRBM domain-containing protein n=1 Tax=Dendrothele bispora (strain CBS 962.96) TaxID=1314807 RepID=A0A4S8MTP7_DENBC|nr:hypothetical protein K435DRAFT_483745 [Dendrothele bispora CBS 962.96]